MTLFTKINGIRALLCAVGMLILFHLFLTFFDKKIDSSISGFSELRARNVHDFTYDFKSNNNTLPKAPASLRKAVSSRNDTVHASPNEKLEKVKAQYYVNKVKGHHPLHVRPSNSSLADCGDADPMSGGPITPNITLESLDRIEKKLGPLLRPGGFFEPSNCKSQHHVAIVVPFRDRYAHLSIFLRNIHPFLMQQNVTYRIFIIEQINGKPFNRAALMNIGYLEAMKIYPWDCFIFHDVDLLPLDSRNVYNCPIQPRHMSVAIDTLNFRLPYFSIFGGVSAMTTEQFKRVNGFSNSFYGWGGEDDDMSNRLKHAGFFISRYPINISRYMMLKHQKEKANPKRYENLVNGISKMEQDGINSIKYAIYNIKEFPTFTWYLAELNIPPSRRTDST